MSQNIQSIIRVWILLVISYCIILHPVICNIVILWLLSDDWCRVRETSCAPGVIWFFVHYFCLNHESVTLAIFSIAIETYRSKSSGDVLKIRDRMKNSFPFSIGAFDDTWTWMKGKEEESWEKFHVPCQLNQNFRRWNKRFW